MPPDAAPDRLEKVLSTTGHALRELRASASPGALTGDLAVVWAAKLGPTERAFLLAAAASAAETEDVDRLCNNWLFGS